MEGLLLLGALGLFLIVKLVRGDPEGRAAERLVKHALEHPARRRAAIARLEMELHGQAYLPESRVALARLYLADDRPEAALEELERAGDDAFLSDRLVLERATTRLLSLVRLHRFDQAEEALNRYSYLFLDEPTAALWADARAQMRLCRGDTEGALAVLDSAEPVPKNARPQLELTRLRVLAARDKNADEVWNGLRAQPRELLELLARRHANEPAAWIAMRLLNGSAYR
jgi:hypothetical protein